MTLPLIILGGLALIAGFLNPGFHIFEHPPLEHWLDPVFDIKHIFASAKPHVIEVANAASLEKVTAIGGIGAFVIGTGLAYWVYAVQGGAPARNLAAMFPRLHRTLLNKWYVDEAYEATAVEAVDALADTSANVIDPWIVDGILAKLSSFLVSAFGTLLRAFQNGVMHMYAALMVVGLAVCGWFFVMPHAHATVDVKPTGVAITAAAGPGYTYRWDLDDDGKPDKETFSNQPVVHVPLEPGASRNVTLEVTNSFGYTPFIARKVVAVSRPPSNDPKPTDTKAGQK
jgi:NADH-quinone oxidoreductase subunit L